MKLGNNLKNIREEKQIRVEDVSNSLKISVEDIESWESNKKVPNMDQLVLLSKYYSVDLDTLLFNEVKPRQKVVVDSTCSSKIIEERNIEIFRRQKKLVELSAYIMYIITAFLAIFTALLVFYFFSTILNFVYFEVYSFVVIGISILLTYFSFRVGFRLMFLSKLSDLEFICTLDEILKYGLILTILVAFIPGSFLIIVYFSTDIEKYYLTHRFYDKSNEKRSLKLYTVDDLLKIIELNNKNLIDDIE